MLFTENDNNDDSGGDGDDDVCFPDGGALPITDGYSWVSTHALLPRFFSSQYWTYRCLHSSHCATQAE